MRNIAGLHAPFWNDPIFDADAWISRMPLSAVANLQDNMDRALVRFKERFSNSFTGDTRQIIEAFVPRYAAWLRADGRNTGLTHNDYRCDNLLFERDGTVVALDWQTFTGGHPGRDMGLFLGCSVPTEIRRAHEEACLCAYRDRLEELGVTHYTLENCYEDFRHGVFLGLQNVLIGMNSLTLTDRAMQMFQIKLERCCVTIRDHNALSVLSATPTRGLPARTQP